MTFNDYIELRKKLESCRNLTYEWTDADEEKYRECNKWLCNKYPFLIPSNRYSGKRITPSEPLYWPGSPDAIPEYHYEHTELDALPTGWVIAFGENLLNELLIDLIKNGRLNNYRITEIKEKWGYLHWYDNGGSENWVQEILPKYEKLSEEVCIHCGEPATYRSLGWESFFCQDCAERIYQKYCGNTNEQTFEMFFTKLEDNV